MKIAKLPLKKEEAITFHTGVKSLFDRRIGKINFLENAQILGESAKLKNVRNGKVRE